MLLPLWALTPIATTEWSLMGCPNCQRYKKNTYKVTYVVTCKRCMKQNTRVITTVVAPPSEDKYVTFIYSSSYF
uniref:Uncharacterized protein n=1 Tax=Ciona intestinalis TaxID=7719 RepID=H2XY53_CIOIN